MKFSSVLLVAVVVVVACVAFAPSCAGFGVGESSELEAASSQWIQPSFVEELVATAPRAAHPARPAAPRKTTRAAASRPAARGAQTAALAPTAPITGVGANKAASIMQRLIKDLGINQMQAAGIMGNVIAESGGALAPNINEKRRACASCGLQGRCGDNKCGYGWCQWTGPRRVNFFAFASQNKLNPQSDEANYQMLYHELKTTYTRCVTALRATKSVKAATDSFQKCFEAPKKITDRSSGANAALASFNRLFPSGF